MDDMTAEQRHMNMRKIRSADTKPELILRKLLWNNGYRYRKNWKELPGKPDIVLTKYRICIFVDSEYFHGKDWEMGKKQKVEEGNDPDYWVPKIEKNIERDKAVDAELHGLGWKVLRFWSREIIKDPESCLSVVKETIFEADVSN